jgi:hypothetical protein
MIQAVTITSFLKPNVTRLLFDRWMPSQTRKPDHWIVVCDAPGDVVLPAAPAGVKLELIRRERVRGEPERSLEMNLLTALLRCSQDAEDLIVFLEDDDWYSPTYVESAAAFTRACNAFRGLRCDVAAKRAAWGRFPPMSSWAIRGSVVRELIGGLNDLRFFKEHDFNVDDRTMTVSMKWKLSFEPEYFLDAGEPLYALAASAVSPPSMALIEEAWRLDMRDSR